MLTRSRRTTNNTPPPTTKKSTTQSQCWTILEVFQWIKDTLKKGIGNYVLDVSQKNGVPCHPNGEGFLIEVVNQETSLKYVVLWANMNTTNTKSERLLQISSKEEQKNEETRVQFRYRYCQPERRMSTETKSWWSTTDSVTESQRTNRCALRNISSDLSQHYEDHASR